MPTVKRAPKGQGGMSVRDAGQKGGERGGRTTLERHGATFFRAIGKKGGESVRDERGAKFFQEIGRMGGQRVRQLINEGKKTGRR